MDFFKSVFSDDPPPPKLAPSEDPDRQNPNPSSWRFGDLVKTLSARSELVLQTCRRDLEEFGSELRKETAAIRDAASRSIGDLDGIGQAIDSLGSSVWRGTAEIISHGRDVVLSADRARDSPRGGLEDQIFGIESDPRTYIEGPEDVDDFERWKLNFLMEEKGKEIGDLCNKNKVVEDFYREFVPGVVDHETFWTRYFYRIHRLKQAEDARFDLGKGAAPKQLEEVSKREVDGSNVTEANAVTESTDKISGIGEVEKKEIADASKSKRPGSNRREGSSDSSDYELIGRSDENSVKESNLREEDEIGWDEIEDLGDEGEKKAMVDVGISTRVDDLRKRLSAANGEEDLSWDTEDDEPSSQ